MKRFAATLLSIMLAISAIGCTKESETTKKKKTTKKTTKKSEEPIDEPTDTEIDPSGKESDMSVVTTTDSSSDTTSPLSSLYVDYSNKMCEAANSFGFTELTDAAEKTALYPDAIKVDSNLYKGGVFATFDQQEAANITIGDLTSPVKKGDIRALTSVCRTEDGGSNMMTLIVDFVTQDAATAFFGTTRSSWNISQKEIKDLAQTLGADYGYLETYTEFAIIFAHSNSSVSIGNYIKIQDTVVVVSIYSGNESSDWVDDYIDLMNEAELFDFEKLIDDTMASDTTSPTS